MKTFEQYQESLRNRKIRLFIRGELVENPVDHPLVAPSILTIGESYRLAEDPQYQDLLVTHSPFIDAPINRFNHIFKTQQDLHNKQAMQRLLGQTTGTCFQRCVGMDAINALYNITFEMDEKLQTDYHANFLNFLKHVQKEDLVMCGAMTDPKGDRKKKPHQAPEMYLRVVEKKENSIVVEGAKVHQTGVVNSHEIIVMPGRAMDEQDKDFVVCFAIPIDTPGITMIYGRQPSDDRRMSCEIDQGTPYGGQEAMVVFEKVEVPMERIFMLGEHEWVAPLVDYFAHHHRHSYGGCKPGNGDVLIGATALIAQMNGVEKVSHVRDKLVEMVHLNETMYGCGVACATCCKKTKADTVMVDKLLANVCKQNVTRFPYEMARLAEDLAGGLLVTMPAEEDLKHPEIGEMIRKYLAGAKGTTEERMRVIRLIETMTIGSTAVAFRTESMHGAGSPQAQRMRIASQANFPKKMELAKKIASIKSTEEKKE